MVDKTEWLLGKIVQETKELKELIKNISINNDRKTEELINHIKNISVNKQNNNIFTNKQNTNFNIYLIILTIIIFISIKFVI